MNNQWNKTGNSYYQSEVSQQQKSLPVGIYNIERDARTGALYLEQTADSFEFNHKLYGVETSLINRVVKTYKHTTGNLGMLLNGVKGTGKTVTSKQIANTLQLPILLINNDYPNMSTFINSIQQDIIVMIDEYEKIYKHEDSSVLTVMDGVLSSEYRRVFMLTTNSLRINDNMIQRPGRLRYIKTFGDLTRPIIEEIVDDLLVHKQFRDNVINFIAMLQLITIDIVTAVVKEVNIHEETPDKFSDVFNVKKNVDLFNVFEIKDDAPILLHKLVTSNFSTFNERTIGEDLNVDNWNFDLGEIKSVIDFRTVMVESLLRLRKDQAIPEGAKIDPENDQWYTIDRMIAIEPAQNLHKSFKSLDVF